jgi:hypothetical protein
MTGVLAWGGRGRWSGYPDVTIHVVAIVVVVVVVIVGVVGVVVVVIVAVAAVAAVAGRSCTGQNPGRASLRRNGASLCPGPAHAAGKAVYAR